MKTYTKLDVAKQIEPDKSKQKGMKQRVSRHIKEHGYKPIQILKQAEHYSEEDANAIIKYFFEVGVSGEPLQSGSKSVHDTAYETLLKQLETKDKQIADLTEQNKALLFKTMTRKEKKLLALASGKADKRSWWKIWEPR